jgi:putative ATPase
LGHGTGYRYPHDDQRGVVTQQYVPDDLVGTDYYQPSPHGAERSVATRLPLLRRIVRGLPAPPARPDTPTAEPPVTAQAASALPGETGRPATGTGAPGTMQDSGTDAAGEGQQ